MTNEELWRLVLNEIEIQTNKAAFNTWFKNTSIVSNKDGSVTVGAPNAFAKEWLADKFSKNILRALKNLSNDTKEVKYIVSQAQTPSAIVAQATPKKEVAVETQKELEIFSVDKETNLNPKYSIDSFIIGESNKLAHASAMAIIKSPGTAYNPLFVYGGTGLGKTHLIQAVGNSLKTQNTHTIKYVPSEKFTSDVINAIQNNCMNKIKEEYRKVDVLIIDDVQFLSGKEKTQEEFFHIFNFLYEKNKQIIISSDRPPKAIPILEERLKSRFEGGMIADISFPDFETRVAILRAKIDQKGINFDENIVTYLADNIQKNIRELEGALNRLSHYATTYKKQPSLDEVKGLLSNLINPPRRLPTPKKIIDVVAEYYQLKEKDLLTKCRRQEIVRPRQVAMYLLREELKSSFPYIGQKLGGKDHTTVIHACDKISREIKINKNLEDEVLEIKQKIFS